MPDKAETTAARREGAHAAGTRGDAPAGPAAASAVPGRAAVAAAPAGYGVRGSARKAAAARDAALGPVNWARPPEGSRRLAFEVPSGRLAALELGPADGVPVVLVPGVMGSKEDFALVLPRLAAAGYRALSFDMAGQYESAAAGPERLDPPGRRYDLRLFVDDLLAVLERTGPAHVTGYSFAGVVAQAALVLRPDLFRSLTLLSCPPVPGQSLARVRWIGWLSPLVGRRLSAALIVWGVRRNFVPAPPDRLAFVERRFARTRRSSIADIVGLMKAVPDLRRALRNAPVPLFVAVGGSDVWPLALHRGFARSIGARIGIYRTGHSPCENSPNLLSLDLLRLFAASAPEPSLSPRT